VRTAAGLTFTPVMCHHGRRAVDCDPCKVQLRIQRLQDRVAQLEREIGQGVAIMRAGARRTVEVDAWIRRNNPDSGSAS